MGRIEQISRRAVIRAVDTTQEMQAQIEAHVRAQDAAISDALKQTKALRATIEQEQRIREAIDANAATFMGRLNWLMFGRR